MARMRWRGLLDAIRSAAGEACSDRRSTALSIAGAWGIYLALTAARIAINRPHHELGIFLRYCIADVPGVAIMWCVQIELNRLKGGSAVVRAGAALALIMPAALALAIITYCAKYMLFPETIWTAKQLRYIFPIKSVMQMLPEKYAFLVGWLALHGAVSGAFRARDGQRRAAVLQAEIHAARLEALRYQLNPHFLFNALNSLSALVMLGDRDRAERVIQAMSTFLRSTLEEGGTEDATLAEELGVQRLYLDIEQVRFGERLRVEWAVPDDLGRAELPPLLLQPIVENVLRHAVAPVSGPVTMTVAARAESDRLHLVVEDDGRGTGVAGGTGIGLRNVASRLAVRYGAAARCDHGPRPGGGFRVEVVLPLHLRPAGA